MPTYYCIITFKRLHIEGAMSVRVFLGHPVLADQIKSISHKIPKVNFYIVPNKYLSIRSVAVVTDQWRERIAYMLLY